MPTLIRVVTFCRSELLRVPQMFTNVTTPIIPMGTMSLPAADSAMIS